MGKQTKKRGTFMLGFGVIATVLGFVLLIWTMGHSPNNMNWTSGWSFKEPMYYGLLAIAGLLIVDGIINVVRGLLRERDATQQNSDVN